MSAVLVAVQVYDPGTGGRLIYPSCELVGVVDLGMACLIEDQ